MTGVEWPWNDHKGQEIMLGSWVRVSESLTAVPTAFPDLLQSKAARQIDFGRVYELVMDNGKIKVEWIRGAGIFEEDPGCLELSTQDAADGFDLGLGQGYEDGFRAGHQHVVNDHRGLLGMPALTEQEFDDSFVKGPGPIA